MDVQFWSFVASAVTAVATVVTMGFLMWYAFLTRSIRCAAQDQVKEAQLQTELARMPVVMFGSKLIRESMLTVLYNAGSGPAFNIRIKGFVGKGTTLTFDSPTNLGSGQDGPVSIIVDWENAGDEHTIEDMRRLKTLFETSDLPELVQTQITYDSVHNKHYETLFTIKYNPHTEYIFVVFDGVKEVRAS